MRNVLWVFLAASLLVGGWYYARHRPVPVDLATIERGTIRAFVEEEGKTRVVDRFVVSSPVSGRLLRVGLEAGDEVAKGAVVARIDPLPLRALVAETRARIGSLRERRVGVETKRPKAQEIEEAANFERQAVEELAVAENDLERANVAWERAVKQLDRTRQLVRQQFAPDSDMDDAIAVEGQTRERFEAQGVRVKIANLSIGAARLRRQILESRMHDFDWEEKDYDQQIAALEATLEKLESDLEDTIIPAPVAGVVLRLHRESEQVVEAGTPLLEIGDLGRLEVEVDFLSEDVARMRVGMEVELSGRVLGDRVLRGRIARIHPSAFTKISSLGVEQQRVKVVVAFEAGDSGLGDLFRVEVRVILEAKDDVVKVPEGALFRQSFPGRERAWYAFKVEGSKARRVRVETGIRDGTDREVLSGLETGDEVILHPDDTIDEGTPLTPLP